MAYDFAGGRASATVSTDWSLPTLHAQPTATAAARPVPQPDSLLVRVVAFTMPIGFCAALLLTTGA